MPVPTVALATLFTSLHTHVRSSIDTLVYRRGKIHTTLSLHPDHQELFERRVESLKLRLSSCLQSAQDDYQKELRKLFVEFGQIAAEPPIELTHVVSKFDEAALAS